MARLIAACALPRLPSTMAGVRRAEASVVVVALSAVARRDGVRPVHRLLDASDHALARGVRPGQRLIDAQRYAPDLRTVIIDEGAVRDELAIVAEQLLSLSPLVEPVVPRSTTALPLLCIAVDLTGLPRPRARLLGDLARILAEGGQPTTVALSSSKTLSVAIAKDLAMRPAAWGTRFFDTDVDAADTARDAARGLRWTGRARVRQRLDLGALDLDTSLVDSLRATGVSTLGDLVPLVQQGLTSRLGPHAAMVLRLLRLTADVVVSDDVVDHKQGAEQGAEQGDNDGIASPLVPAEVVGASRDLEYGVLHLEPLLFVLRPLVESIVSRLERRRLRLGELTVALGARRRPPTVLSVAFSVPTADAAVVLRVLTTRLERAFQEATAHHQRGTDRHGGNVGGGGASDDDDSHLLSLGDDGIERLMLVARRTVSFSARQLGLGTAPDSAPPEALLHLVSELSASYGEHRVGCLSVSRAPLPEAMSTLRPPTTHSQHLLHLEEHLPPRRRRPRPVVTDPRTSYGRFAAGWPWPLRLLTPPQPLSWADDDVAFDAPFATLEGQDAIGPWRRRYRLVTLRDGRRALVLVDDDAGCTSIQGWFD